MKTENDWWWLPFNYHVSSFQKLLKMSQQQSRSAYKQAQLDLIDYLDRKVFTVHLIDPSRVTAYEIFCYSNGNMGNHHIRGSMRAAMHLGMNDPQTYLDVSEGARSSYIRFQLTLPSHTGTFSKNRSRLICEIKFLNNINEALHPQKHAVPPSVNIEYYYELCISNYDL